MRLVIDLTIPSNSTKSALNFKESLDRFEREISNSHQLSKQYLEKIELLEAKVCDKTKTINNLKDDIKVKGSNPRN